MMCPNASWWEQVHFLPLIRRTHVSLHWGHFNFELIYFVESHFVTWSDHEPVEALETDIASA